MSLNTFLVDHALKNTWCTPDQDKQVIFKPAKISRGAGVKNDIRIMWDQYKLPTPNQRYHVYQIGQIHPVIIGLIENVYRWHANPTAPSTNEYYSSDNIWIPFNQICNEERLVADFYVDSGIQLPRSTTYAMVTDDKNLVIAVRDQPKILPDLYLQNFYVRLYSNAFFDSIRSNDYPHSITVGYGVMNSPTHISNMNSTIAGLKLQRGAVFVYVNGVFVDNVYPSNTAVGDVVEWYRDSTVKQIVDIPLITAEAFDSTMDLKRKYLLTYPESDANDLIDYQDDIDFYLVAQTQPILNPVLFKGCYFHKNRSDAIRMVTHKDYSMCVPYVDVYVDDHDFLGGSTDTVIAKLYIREAGYDRALVNDHNRIKELYKLTDEQVTRAMVGIDAVVPNWRAETLEESAYTRVMRSKSINVTKQLVQDAYGYNAISKLIADTPIYVDEAPIRYAPLPEGLRTNSTIAELDADGYLIEVYHQINDPDYFPHNLNCVMVDGVMGLPSNHLDMVFGEQVTVLNPLYTYRMYKTRKIDGEIQWSDWEDVTGTAAYIKVGNTITWTLDDALWYTCIKSDQFVLSYSFTQNHSDYLINFTIANEEEHDSVVLTKALNIAPGNIDVWLNKKYLIEGLDYFIRWPDIVICNKEFLARTFTTNVALTGVGSLIQDGNDLTGITVATCKLTGQTNTAENGYYNYVKNGSSYELNKYADIINNDDCDFTVRCTGFCTTDMVPEPPDEFGFVINGVLSRDTVFDIRDDKVILIAIEGALRSRENLIFTENLPTVLAPDVRNGAPYVIKDVIVPMRDATIADTNVLRERSLLVDKAVSDYMSMYLPEVPDLLPNIIPHRYNLFSPFCARIMHDLINNILVIPIDQHYSEMDMVGWLSDYEWILPFDPCRNTIDENYVTIHPHPLYTTIQLNVYQYAFMERVIAFYLFNKVDLTRFVTMTIS